MTWVFLWVLVASVYLEAYDQGQWLGVIRLPARSNLTSSVNGSNLPITRLLVQVCVAWASFSLGWGRWPGALYTALFFSLIVGFGLQTVAPGSKFQVGELMLSRAPCLAA